MDHQVRRTGTSGKFFDSLRPPEFTGERHEFEAWSQRFTWYIRNKSAVFADIIRDVANMPPGMSLAALGFWAARQSHSLTTATATIQMGLELHGYLQSALQASGLDRTLLPQAQSNGFEVWRLLHDRFKPHTATTALVDLREIVLNTDLLSEGNFTQRLLEWEHRVNKFTERYGMVIPDLLKYLIIMNNAPMELQSHICLTYNHRTAYNTIKDAVMSYMAAWSAPRVNQQGPTPMDIGAINKGKG